jgi:hypothetical protein
MTEKEGKSRKFGDLSAEKYEMPGGTKYLMGSLQVIRNPHNVFNLISVPWGPACATLVTYPAGMAGNASLSQIFIGPTDPSARDWLPEDYLAIGIPEDMARKMANDVGRSFLAKRDNIS